MKFEKIVVQNPGDSYKVIAEIEATQAYEIDKKVEIAHTSFASWSEQTVEERVSILQKLLANFTLQKNEIAKLIAIEMGMPISVCMKIDIQVGLNFFQTYLNNATSWLAPEIVFKNEREEHTLYCEPLGVVAASVPWNYPFTNFIWAVIPNLIVGNTMVVKHSENCVLTTQLLEKIMNNTDLPQGICNFVYGQGRDVGEYVINSDVDMIWFTGSVATGHHVYQVAAAKDIPVLLELGGSAPGIVFNDVDIDAVVESIYFYRFMNNGQTCDGLKRLLVHESIFDQVVHKLSVVCSQKVIGNPSDTSTDIGPLANQKQLQMLEVQVADAIEKGAKIVCGGKKPSHASGAYYQPTIMTNISYDMKVWKEEVFGPVLPIVSFKTEDDAINLANDTIFGLGGYVYSQNKNRALDVAKKLKTGNVSINGTDYVIGQDPFGGYKKSGIGREHGALGLRSFCQSKVIAMNKKEETL